MAVVVGSKAETGQAEAAGRQGFLDEGVRFWQRWGVERHRAVMVPQFKVWSIVSGK